MCPSFICPYCQALVIPEHHHVACRKTCGARECQVKLNAEHIKRSDWLKQQQKIQERKDQGIDLVTCQICNEEFEMIHHSHLKKHGLTLAQYREKFPRSPMLNSRMRQIKVATAANRSQYLVYPGKEPDAKLYEFLTGSLLGDGSLEKRSGKRNARYAEGGNNQTYLAWKKSLLENYFPCTFQERLSSPHCKTGKQYRGWWLRTGVHPELTKFRAIWYAERKILPKDWIREYLTEFALSIWFYDDGCSGSGLFLYTLSFSQDEVLFLSGLLQEKFDLKNSILQNKSNQYFIRISNYSKNRFLEILHRNPVPGMEYKRLL